MGCLVCPQVRPRLVMCDLQTRMPDRYRVQLPCSSAIKPSPERLERPPRVSGVLPPSASGRESCRGLLLSCRPHALFISTCLFHSQQPDLSFASCSSGPDAARGQPDICERRDRPGCSSIDLAAKSWCRVWGRQPGTYKHRRPPRSLCRIQTAPGVRAMASRGVVRWQIGHGAAQQERVDSALSPCVAR
jgi:hypothetical protein